MPTHLDRSHFIKTIVAPLAAVFGAFLLGIGWAGNWLMNGTWPGPVRLWVATVLGVIGVGWGAAKLRRFAQIDGGRQPLAAGQVAGIVGGLIVGGILLVLFYNW